MSYLHGHTPKEQSRLRDQARYLEHVVYQDINFFGGKNVLEVGCGVGAQSEILLRRFPRLHLTGVDYNQVQLDSAQAHLDSLGMFKDRYEFKQMDASDLHLDSSSFDGAFLCWILEHVKNPLQVLSEVRRVLSPGATAYVTEVMNFSFFLDPYSPALWKYWMAFNDFQYEFAGDPFIGAKLGNLLLAAGFKDVQTKVKTLHYDHREPERRKEVIEYWTELMLSASDLLISSKATTTEVVEEAVKELKKIRKDPQAVFFYSFMLASAKA